MRDIVLTSYERCWTWTLLNEQRTIPRYCLWVYYLYSECLVWREIESNLLKNNADTPKYILITLSHSATVSWLISLICLRNINKFGCATFIRCHKAAWKLSTPLLLRSRLLVTINCSIYTVCVCYSRSTFNLHYLQFPHNTIYNTIQFIWFSAP